MITRATTIQRVDNTVVTVTDNAAHSGDNTFCLYNWCLFGKIPFYFSVRNMARCQQEERNLNGLTLF
jgi:hypothetical protein